MADETQSDDDLKPTDLPATATGPDAE